MTAVTYTAKRSLISGHTENTSYSLDLNVLDTTPGFAREVQNITNDSLSGARENMRLHAIKRYEVQLAPLKGGTPLDTVLEFLDSVEALESFTWDFYGSVATPHAAVTATLDQPGYRLERYQPIGAGGSTDYFTLSFTVRVVVA